MRKLVKMCWDQGWWCVQGGNNHTKCYPPSGANMISVPSTPSGHNTYANKLAAMVRAGLTP